MQINMITMTDYTQWNTHTDTGSNEESSIPQESVERFF